MAITSRDDLKEYCLRRLGDPVIKINVEDDQLEDRIDDAIEYFREYHSDGIEKVFKVITIQQTDIDAKEIDIADPLIYTVNKIISISESSQSANDRSFSLEHQFVSGELNNIRDMDLVSYELLNQKLDLINRMFAVGQAVQYNRYKNKVKLYIDWDNITPNEGFVVLECERFIDLTTATATYNDRWLKKYTTALFKKQWGDNLKKLNGVQLPGGITIPGQQIYDEAVDEIAKLEEEMIDWYSEPVDFFIG